jgi:hypothetical protein
LAGQKASTAKEEKQDRNQDTAQAAAALTTQAGLERDGHTIGMESSMNRKRHLQISQCITYRLLFALIFVVHVTLAAAQTDSGVANAAAQAAERDGQHDFDFELGSWKIHLKRRLRPLTGSNTWVEIDGTSVTRKLWDGRAQIEEFETDGAGGHIEGLTLRLYNPQTHE